MDKKKGIVGREEELDRFWDIDSLVPKKKVGYSGPVDTSTTEIEIPASNNSAEEPQKHPIPAADSTVRRFIPPHSAEQEEAHSKPLDEYTPDNALIRHVRIYRPKSSYQYYEAFVRDAIRLYPIHGVECERVTFFSYVPQYSQMNRPQLEWYLWWRECVRSGQYLQTDYSFILLYIYELINLSEKLDAELVLGELCGIWEHYREVYRQLDGYLSEWICDFCLLHRLSAKDRIPKALQTVAMQHAALKEFYFSTDAASGYAGALIAFCNNYDYKKSKFYVGENEKLFDRYIPMVLNSVVELLSTDGQLFATAHMDDSRMMRNAYTGALCAFRLKRNIEVEYCSFSRSNELRYFITDVVKYTENCLRAYLGVRSRLTVYSLPQDVRTHVDEMMQANLPKRPIAKKIKREEPKPEYEKLYDLPTTSLSLENAALIEQASWNTTEKLIQAFSDEIESENQPDLFVPIVPETPQFFEDFAESTEKNDDFCEALFQYAAFLRAVDGGDFALQRKIAKESGKLLDALADEINALSADLFGDILLEDIGDGYAPIEDYRDMLADMIAKFDANAKE